MHIKINLKVRKLVCNYEFYLCTSIKSVCDCRLPFLSYDSVFTIPIPLAYHSTFLVFILNPIAEEFTSLVNL